MKQIIVVTDERNNYEAAFEQKGYYVTWCPSDLDAIISVRDRADIFFFCVSNEDTDLLKRIGLYMRDLCIEDEKIVYIYGRKDAVDILSRLIPAMFVQMAQYAFIGTFTSMLDDMRGLEEAEGRDRPTLLIIDDDKDFISKLRILVNAHFNVYVSHCDLRESGMLLMRSDIVLMSTSAKYSLMEIMDFFRSMVKKKRQNRLHFYYLAADETECDIINVTGDREAFAFPRSVDPRIIADYLIESTKGVR